jgi:hypothetical protein
MSASSPEAFVEAEAMAAAWRIDDRWIDQWEDLAQWLPPLGRTETGAVCDRHSATVTRVTETVPTLVELPRPRALTEAERALMTRLVTFADVPSLSEQVATARVVSSCDCGCASVGLRTEGPQVPATAVARLSDTGRDDYFSVSASGGDGVSVVLHVLSGFVGELEIFAGEGVPVAAPHADTVINIWIG